MKHSEHDKIRKKRKVEVSCSTCRYKYTMRMDTSRKWYRKYRKLGSVKCRSCISKILTQRNKKQLGFKNPNWKGGRTPEIQKFYNSEEWKQLRTKAFKRDDYTCQDCNQRGGQLEANHIKARWKYPKLRLKLSNTETLCKLCHNKKKWMVYI